MRFRHGRGPVRTGRQNMRAVRTVVGRSGRAKLERARANVSSRVFRNSLTFGELKGVDTNLQLTSSNIPSTTTTNTGSFVLNLVAPGNGSFNRVGRKISMKSLRLRGVASATLDDNASVSPTQCLTLRMVVVFDTQPGGVLPTFDTIFGNTDQTGAETCVTLSALRYDNTARFRVLRDWVRTFSADSTNPALGSGNDYVEFDEFIDLKGLVTVYSGQSSPCTITDIASGGLYVFFRADSNTGASAQAQILAASTARLRYTD